MASLTICRRLLNPESPFEEEEFLGDILNSYEPPMVTTITVRRTTPQPRIIPLPSSRRFTPFDIRARRCTMRPFLATPSESGSETPCLSSPASSSLSVPQSEMSSSDSSTGELLTANFPDTSHLFVFCMHDDNASRDSHETQPPPSPPPPPPSTVLQPMPAVQCTEIKKTLSKHPRQMNPTGRLLKSAKIETKKTTELRRSKRFSIRLRPVKDQ